MARVLIIENISHAHTFVEEMFSEQYVFECKDEAVVCAITLRYDCDGTIVKIQLRDDEMAEIIKTYTKYLEKHGLTLNEVIK